MTLTGHWENGTNVPLTKDDQGIGPSILPSALSVGTLDPFGIEEVPEIVENSEHAFVVVEQLRACLGAGFAILRCGFRRRRTLFRREAKQHSGLKANTIGAKRRWLSDCARSVRLRQEKLSGAKRRRAAASGERGAGKGAAAPFPAQHWSGLADLNTSTTFHVFSSSNRHAFRCDVRCEPVGRGCRRPRSDRRSVHASE